MLALTINAVRELSSLRAGEPLPRLGNDAHITMDFETRSRLDLNKVGAFKYAQDDSTSVLCLGYDLGDGVDRIWHPFVKELPTDLFDAIKSGRLVEAHNAEFEYCIWKYVCVAKMKWPVELPAHQLRCSAAKGAAVAMPRKLEELCIALNSEVKKDMTGKKVMQKMSKPRKLTKKNQNEFHDGLEDWERLFDYNIDDVRAEKSASKLLPPLTPQEQKIWELTLKMNERGIYCDVELCKIALDFSKRIEFELNNELFEITNGVVRTAKQLDKMKEFLKIHGVLIEDLTVGSVRDMLEAESMTPVARRVLQIRQSLAKASVKKLTRMLQMAGRDNRIRGTLLFDGASTGRYAGRGIQPQNFTKPLIKDVGNVFKLLEMGDFEFFRTVFPDVFTALSAGLRGMLRAAPGKILRVADFAGIEARIIQWLAGDYKNLKVYYTNGDPYVDMAMLIFDKPRSMVTKKDRELGKRAVLGCGFGMGHIKFQSTCLEQGNLEISLELAKRAVVAYREKYHLVKSFWYDLERAAILAVKCPGQLIEFKNLQWLKKGRWLYCRLPSGRRLAYYHPIIKTEDSKWGLKEVLTYMAVHPKTKKWFRERTYGGKLAENVTQAVAACCLRSAMLGVESQGYSVILTVHDEVISEDAKEFGSLGDFEYLMSIVPKWADGLPIKVESYEAERYRK